MVSKTGCKACSKAKTLLNQLADKTGCVPYVFEVSTLERKEKKTFIKCLSLQTGIRTVPQIWINGTFVGGNDDIQQQHREGRLVPLILRSTRRSQNRTGSSFQSRSPSPSMSFSVRSAPTPQKDRHNKWSGYGRRKSQHDEPTSFANTAFTTQEDRRRSYSGAPIPETFSQAWEDEKWDISMARQPLSQLHPNSILERDANSFVSNSSGWTQPTFGPTQVEQSNWISTSDIVNGNGLTVFLPSASDSKPDWVASQWI